VADDGTALTGPEAYQAAAARFGETITQLADEEWELPTRPDDWTVATTTAWIVVGDAAVSSALEHGTITTAGDFDAAILGPNPVASWRGTAVAAITALREPGAVERIVVHDEGPLAVQDLIGQRVTENLVRAWDIGAAVGRPAEPDEALAEWALDFWADHTDAVLRRGVLGDAPTEPLPGASAAVRLLALTGR